MSGSGVFPTRMNLTAYKGKQVGAQKGACPAWAGGEGVEAARRVLGVVLHSSRGGGHTKPRTHPPPSSPPPTSTGYELLKKKSDAMTARLRSLLRELSVALASP